MGRYTNFVQWIPMKVAIKIFLQHGTQYVFSPGRRELLKSVKTTGSLKQAAIEINTSYRWAWQRLHETERELGRALLERTDEPINGRPLVLTAEAEALLRWLDTVEKQVHICLQQADKNLPQFLANSPTRNQDKETAIRFILD